MPERRRLVLHVQQREQRPDLGLPQASATGAAGSTRATTRCRGARAAGPACQPDGDERGLPGPRGSRADGPVPARRPAGRVAARLDDDALDARGERRRGGRRGPARTSGSARATGRSGSARARSRRRSSGRSRSSRRSPAPSSSGWRYAGPFDELPAVRRGVRRARATSRTPTSTGSSPWDRGRRGRGDRASSTSRRAAAPRTSSSARRSGCRSSARSTRTAATTTGFGWLSRLEAPGGRRADRRRPRAARASSTTSSRTRTATRTAGAAARRCCSGSSTSGSSRWARSTTGRATS